MPRSGRMTALVVLAAGLGLFGACGGDDSGTDPGGAGIYGTYTLIEAAGKTIPAVLEEQSGYKLELTGGSIRLHDDQTFSFRLDFRETQDGQVSTQEVVETGTFSVTGSQINFEGGVAASVSGGRITMAFEGVTMIFQK